MNQTFSFIITSPQKYRLQNTVALSFNILSALFILENQWFLTKPHKTQTLTVTFGWARPGSADTDILLPDGTGIAANGGLERFGGTLPRLGLLFCEPASASMLNWLIAYHIKTINISKHEYIPWQGSFHGCNYFPAFKSFICRLSCLVRVSFRELLHQLLCKDFLPVAHHCFAPPNRP